MRYTLHLIGTVVPLKQQTKRWQERSAQAGIEERVHILHLCHKFVYIQCTCMYVKCKTLLLMDVIVQLLLNILGLYFVAQLHVTSKESQAAWNKNCP